ncbi:MAG: T9SS type A sorting domain-containing protein [Saprospiraceae bacterium]|nr:T9SS type A sorting domain-containing protein [Saprospiraceae bacterium]
MKQFLLATLLTSCFMQFTTAQAVTLRLTDFALSATARDSSMSKLMKKTGATLPTKGLDKTWDYTALRDSTSELYYFGYVTQPATSPRPAGFSSATLQANSVTNFQAYTIPSRTYYQLNSSGFSFLGDSLAPTRFSLQAITGGSTDSLSFPANVHVYSAPVVQYLFPMTMSTAWTSFERVVTDFNLKVIAFGLNNTPGQSVSRGTYRDSIVGWGTLKMRHPSTGATLSFNALLDRRTFITQDSFYLNGTPANPLIVNAFGLTQGKIDTTTRYYFYASGFKSPLIAFSVNNSETQIVDIFRAILPSLGLTTKNNELVDLEVATTVFPNPTTEGATFEFDKSSADTWRVFVYNAAGQIIKNESVNAPIGKTQHTTRFDSSLPTGTYFYQIIDEHSLIRHTGKVQLNR